MPTRNQSLTVLDARFRQIVLSSKGTIPIISNMLCKQETTERAYEKYNYWAGVDEVGEVAENQVFPEKDIKQGDDATITPRKFGCVINVTKELVDDNLFTPIMAVIAKALKNSMVQTKERQAVNLFNNAFDAGVQTTPDGVALASTAHILKQTNGTQANATTAAALDLDSLWGLINVAATALDDSGLYASIYIPEYAVVPQVLVRRIHELMHSDWVPQSTENTENVMKGLYQLKPLSTPLLTSTTAWFLQTNPSTLIYPNLIALEREPLSIKPLFDVKGADLGNAVDRDVYNWRAKERYGYGVIHWNGFFANAGA